jgi:putative spermidine/putrescine transport system ATP-binding protein
LSKLSVSNLVKRFGDFTAVNKANFNVEEGTLVTLLGPSGCGKTTLLRSIAGFYYPDEGNIFFDGVKVDNVPPSKRNTSMCFQSYALFPHMSVWKNIAFGLENLKIPKLQIVERVAEVMRMVNLTGLENRKPAQLSGGQQQRVALARALVTRPDIMLFDEPLSNLDAKMRDQVRIEIRELQLSLGLTAVYVTHDQAEALSMSDKIIVINDGIVQQIGGPEEIYNKPVNSFVAQFLGSANIHEGTIFEHIDNYTVIDCPLGRIRIPKNDKSPGKKVKFCWRPERTEFKINSEHNVIKGKVKRRVFMGNLLEVFFVINDQMVKVQAPCWIPDEDELAFSLSPESFILLEE